MAPFPHEGVDTGATNAPDPDPSATASGHDGSGALRAEAESADIRRLDLASVIHESGCQCRGHTLGWTIRDRDAQQLAQGVLDAGYRLVSEDDTTVDRVAAELADVDGYLWPEEGEVEAAAQAGLSCTIADVDYYRDRARAAVRALREGQT